MLAVDCASVEAYKIASQVLATVTTMSKKLKSISGNNPTLNCSSDNLEYSAADPLYWERKSGAGQAASPTEKVSAGGKIFCDWAVFLRKPETISTGTIDEYSADPMPADATGSAVEAARCPGSIAGGPLAQ